MAINTKPNKANKEIESSTLVWITVFLSTLLIIAIFYSNWNIYKDDSYISLRYVKNLLDGNGMTWNAGERIEGYTNFLWIILTAFLVYFGIDPVTSTRILGVSCYIGIVYACYSFFRKQSESLNTSDPKDKLLVTIVPTAVLATSLNLIGCSLFGLETNLFVLLASGGIISTINIIQNVDGDLRHNVRRAISAGLLFSMAALTRPEGLLFAGASGLFLLVVLIKRNGLIKTIKPGYGFYILGGFGLTILTVIAPYLMWKYWYFGDILPNTYYTKAYGFEGEVKEFILNSGIKYFFGFLLEPPLINFLIIIGSVIYFSKNKKWSPVIFYLFIVIATVSLYTIKVGGDFMEYHRFLVPLLPSIVVLLFFVMYDLAARHITKYIKSISIFIIVLIFMQLSIIDKRRATYSYGALVGNIVSDYVGKNFPKGSVIALSTAGVLPYKVSDNYYIDMLGLLDKHISHKKISKIPANPKIGHLKSDIDYVLSREPDYILSYRLNEVDDEKRDSNNYSYKGYTKKNVWIDISDKLYWHAENVFMKRGYPSLIKDKKVFFTYYERIKNK
ncbi:MAG: hypothetical protein R3D71_03060 [Rickettsiales bacterium]